MRLKKSKWINIPSPRYPVTLKYLILWVIAPIKPFIFTNIAKIKNANLLGFVFKLGNTLLRWPIKVNYNNNVNLFEIIEGDIKLYIKRIQYLKLYSKGIKKRFQLLINQYHLNDIDFSKDDLVIDVGANVGEISLILSKYFDCSTFSIEPEEAEYKCLKLNLEGYDSDFLNNPLWKEEKALPFYSANEELDSSCFETEDYTQIIEKDAKTLTNIIESFNGRRVKLLKLEAEGAEPEILQGGINSLHLVDYISADVGPERGLSYETTLVSTVNILKNCGFELIKMGHPRLICLFKNISLELPAKNNKKKIL